MLRTYETIFVLNPEADSSSKEQVQEKFKNFVTSSGGEIGISDDWGVRDLNFPIKKKAQGNYYYYAYTAGTDSIKEIEFFLKISEPVLTYLTVKLNDEANLENIKKPDIKDLM
jgi:small subunit ribosomal protein S6